MKAINATILGLALVVSSAASAIPVITLVPSAHSTPITLNGDYFAGAWCCSHTRADMSAASRRNHAAARSHSRQTARSRHKQNGAGEFTNTTIITNSSVPDSPRGVSADLELDGILGNQGLPPELGLQQIAMGGDTIYSLPSVPGTPNSGIAVPEPSMLLLFCLGLLSLIFVNPNKQDRTPAATNLS